MPERLEIVTPRLLLAKVGVDRHVAGSSLYVDCL